MTPKIPPPDAWTLDELAQKANEELSRRGLLARSGVDSRMAETITSRNLRRLVSVGAVSAPAKLGREAYYGPQHLEEVVAARDLMVQGFSASAVKSLREKSVEESDPLYLSSASSLASSSGTAGFYGAPDSFAMQMSAMRFNAGGLDSGAAAFAAQTTLKDPAPSTALATNFLDALGSKDASAMGSSELPRPALFSASAGSASPSALASSMLSQAYGRSADALWIDQKAGPEGAQTRAEALRLKTGAAMLSRAAVDCQPWPGLRMTVSADAASAPLTDEQRRHAMAALESAWSKARMMARLGLDEPARLGPDGGP